MASRRSVRIFSCHGSRLQDVWPDNAGGAVGILFAIVILLLLTSIHGIMSNPE